MSSDKREVPDLLQALKDSLHASIGPVPSRPAPDTEAPSEDADLIPVERVTLGEQVTRERLLPPATEKLLVAYRERIAEHDEARTDLAARDTELAEARAEVERLTRLVESLRRLLVSLRASRDEYRDWFRDLRARRYRVLTLCDEHANDVAPDTLIDLVRTALTGAETDA